MPRADSAAGAGAFAVGGWRKRAADRNDALADSPRAMRATKVVPERRGEVERVAAN
jgi:hypothetical protein